MVIYDDRFVRMQMVFTLQPPAGVDQNLTADNEERLQFDSDAQGGQKYWTVDDPQFGGEAVIAVRRKFGSTIEAVSP